MCVWLFCVLLDAVGLHMAPDGDILNFPNPLEVREQPLTCNVPPGARHSRMWSPCDIVT